MTRYLPDDQVRCSAYWYALHAGMITGSPPPGEADLEFLRELGLRAARLARWEGVPAVTASEGPFTVYLWPERIWSEVAGAMAAHAAPGDSFWSYPAPPEDTQAYVDWCHMALDKDGVTYRELTDAEEAAEAATWD